MNWDRNMKHIFMVLFIVAILIGYHHTNSEHSKRVELERRLAGVEFYKAHNQQVGITFVHLPDEIDKLLLDSVIVYYQVGGDSLVSGFVKMKTGEAPKDSL